LFFDVARIIAEKRPKGFLLENVKNLLRHDHGRTFEVIREVLSKELGYELHWKVINGSNFTPQNRERVILVGFDGETRFDWNAFVVPDLAPTMKSVLHPEDGTELAEIPYTEGSMAKVADKYTLSPKLWQYLQAYSAKHKLAGNGFGYGIVGPDDRARTLSARYHKDGSEILVSQGNGQLPRRLTPREAARLMGFEDSFVIPVSDTQAYRQFGNSVVVPVIKEVARIMLPHIRPLQAARRAA
jgi:DNA (cytosine-5)-methyltransferase 1